MADGAPGQPASYRIPRGTHATVWLRDHPWLSFAGFIVGLAALVLACLSIWAPHVLTGNPPLKLNDAGTVGPVTVRVASVECGKSVDDLSPGLRADLDETAPEDFSAADAFQGQLCLADVTVANSSNSSLGIPLLIGTLVVGDERYEMFGIDQESSDPLTLFPNEAQQVSYIFDVPEGVAPTGMEFSWVGEGDQEEIDAVL